MDDPIQRHPTRTEQLDILTTCLAEAGADRVLDLGCGTGYVAHRLLRKAPGLHITGVDVSGDALSAAVEALAPLDGDFRPVQGDLMAPTDIDVAPADFDLACTCLTFHDLTDAGKQAVIRWVATRLRPGGLFFIYDRLRLVTPELFPAQRSIWRRIQDTYGRGMRSAERFEDYLADLGQGNDPAALEDYLVWYRAAGFEPAVLHLHGNIALLAGALRRG